jgi:hypothetical protein
VWAFFQDPLFFLLELTSSRHRSIAPSGSFGARGPLHQKEGFAARVARFLRLAEWVDEVSPAPSRIHAALVRFLFGIQGVLL